MSDDGDGGWIVIPNWDRYQHYADRDPIWIKDYVSQLHDADYIELPLVLRGLLASLRLLYAASDGQVQNSASRISRALNVRVLSAQLKALNHAGFLAFSASKPLALARARERSREETYREEQEKNGDRASSRKPPESRRVPATRQNASGYRPAEPAPVDATVDEQMLQLARGWLADHKGTATRRPKWTATEDEPF